MSKIDKQELINYIKSMRDVNRSLKDCGIIPEEYFLGATFAWDALIDYFELDGKDNK